MKYCAHCGAQLVDEAVVCPKCGCAVAPTKTVDPNASPKSRLIALLLCIFVGGLGIHRFYVGKIGTGVLWLLTAGCFGIGALVDLIMIACGTFTDSDGKLSRHSFSISRFISRPPWFPPAARQARTALSPRRFPGARS